MAFNIKNFSAANIRETEIMIRDLPGYKEAVAGATREWVDTLIYGYALAKEEMRIAGLEVN